MLDAITIPGTHWGSRMPADPPNSVTRWIRGVQGGDPAAADALWKRYYEQLVCLARRKLGGSPRRVADEEDVALLAFHTFFRAAQEGRFPELADRHELWRLLIKLAAEKAVDLIRYNARRKRRGLGQSAIARGDNDSRTGDLDQVIGDSPSPEFAVEVADECRHLLGILDDPVLRAVAIAKMEGLTNEAIARARKCSVRTVERQLKLIRKMWETAAPRGNARTPPTAPDTDRGQL